MTPHPATLPFNALDKHRIPGLPLAPPDDTDRTPRHARAGGSMALRPVQSAVLNGLERFGGFVGFVGVGYGKTLISALAPAAAGVEGARALLFVPAGLDAEFSRECAKYAPHFDIDPPRVATYPTLSRETGVGYLDSLDPDLLILDEAHNVRNATAARTRRLIRFLERRRTAGRPVKILALSGTLITQSVMDGPHLFAYALGALSPIPLDYNTLVSWSRVLDPDPRAPPLEGDYSTLQPLRTWAGGVEPRAAFGARLATAPGVTVAAGLSCDAALTFHAWGPAVPAEVDRALAALRLTESRPDGEAVFDALEMARLEAQISQGFYTRFDWNGAPDYEWLHKRSAYQRELHQYLKRAPEGRDTPALAERGLREGTVKRATLRAAWLDWLTVAERPEPPSEAVWISDYLIAPVAAWAASGPGLVWYSDLAVAEALERAGVEVIRAGERPEPPARALAVSAHAHGTGLNLQPWARNLVLCPPPSPAPLEQLIGRTHRPGQAAPCVSVELFTRPGPLRRAWADCARKAGKLATLTGQTYRVGPETKLLTTAPGVPIVLDTAPGTGGNTR